MIQPSLTLTARLAVLAIMVFGFQHTTMAETKVTQWHGYEKAVQITNGELSSRIGSGSGWPSC